VTCSRTQKLALIDVPLAICRLSPAADVPAWATASSPFLSISRTSDELSIVCPEEHVPLGTKAERGWRALKLQGPFDLSMTGVLVSILSPLAEARIPVFAISTFDTDYVLVQSQKVRAAATVLSRHGHDVALTNDKLTSVK
jgi:hypothetical protein